LLFQYTIANVRRVLCLLLLLLFCQVSLARISLFSDTDPLTPQAVSVQYFFDTGTDRTVQHFLAIRHQLQNVTSDNLTMSYREGMFWITIDLSRLSPAEFDYVLVHNPHINFLGAWIVQDSTVVQQFSLTGDHFPFSTRAIQHTQFVYTLKPHYSTGKLVLLADKRNEQLHLPVYFFSANNFVRYNRNNNLVVGLITGISIFVLLFTLFLYFNMREKLYVFYALYVLMVAGYILSDAGLSFMIFYPNHPSLADFARPLTISVAPIIYILFARNLLRVEEHFPGLYRLSNWYIGVFMLLFLMGFGLVPNTGSIRTFWLVLMQVVMMASIVPVFAFAFTAYRKGIKFAGYIIVASTFFTVFTQLYMQYITGNLSDGLFTRNAVNIGFTVEICLLALALSIRFKNYKEEAEAALRKLNRQQEAIFKNISEYQEKEMKRISSLLHDSVGAGLSSIKYNLESIAHNPANNDQILQSTIEDITTLTDEIRNISHNLSPLLLQKKGLTKGLQDLIGQYNRTGKVQVYLEEIGSLRRTTFQHEILVYRIIQELLHNAIKHSCATEIIIQLMLEPELVSVFVEDDGRGFNKETAKEGLGFSQIKGLVTFVNGHFEVDSQVNKGCRVSIEFPVIPHEWTDQSIAGRRPPYVFGRG
jgi:two-component system, sensor histidine kinase LadS